MKTAAVELKYQYGHALLLLGFVLLVINHLSVVTGDAWLIPQFLKLQ